MRLITLYLRSRQAGRAVAVLAAIALTTWLWALWTGAETITSALLPLAMPLAAAAVIGTGAGSPFGESETTASHPLAPPRAGHPAGLLGLAALVLALAALHWSVADGGWLLVRNLAGFTGLSLLTARALGSGLSWTVPLAYAVLSLVARQSAQLPAWAWPARGATDRGAALIAAALLIAGLVLATRSERATSRLRLYERAG
jgi:hypothetical protein